MTTWLKQSTATDVELGPFVDSTDGVSPETALTISQVDCQLIKNGGAAAQKNDATSATHLAGGHYKVPLNATDTGTLGRLRLYVNESGAVPVWRDFMVVPANIYDSLVGGSDYIDVSLVQVSGSAVSTTTAQIGVNVVQISADSTAADNAESFFDGTGYAGTNNTIPTVTNVTTVNGLAAGVITAAAVATGAIDADALAADAGTEIGTAVWATATRTLTSSLDPTAASIADAVWDEARSGHVSAGTFGEGVVVNSIANGAVTAAAVATGAIDADALAADAGTEIGTAVWATAARTLTAATNITSTGAAVPITGGGLVSADVTAISTDTAAADNAESFFDGTGYAGTGNTIPAVTVVNGLASGSITAAAIATGAIDADALAADAVAEIADGVWDEARSGHTTAGTFGQGVASVQGNVTGSVGSVTGSISGSVASVTGNVGGNVVGSVGSVTGNVGGNVVGTVASVTGNVAGSVGSLAAQAKADVNAEMVDVLTTDTYAEPGSVPAATSSLKDKIGFIFAALRNKRLTTATTDTIRNDADSAAIGAATLDDDGTTFSRGEYA
jgi:hypothetical protein